MEMRVLGVEAGQQRLWEFYFGESQHHRRNEHHFEPRGNAQQWRAWLRGASKSISAKGQPNLTESINIFPMALNGQELDHRVDHVASV